VQLRQDLASVFAAPIIAHVNWGVVARSLSSGEVLYELDARKLMVPASNMKIVTLAGAAHALTWGHRFTTTLETGGNIQAGTLHGDLIVRGGGDPTINARNGRGAAVFDEWAAALRTAGIARIAGRIIGDDQAFDDEGLGAGWAWDDLHAGYAAPVGALQYNEGFAELAVAPGTAPGDPAIVRLPSGTGLTIVNRAFTGPPHAPESVSVRRHVDRPVLDIAGLVPMLPAPGDPAAARSRRVVREVAVVNPTIYFVQSLKEALIARGIGVDGDAVDADDVAASLLGAADASARRVLVATESPPLRDIAPVLMKVSQNLYAETLLKAAGVPRGGLGTVAAGRAAVRRALRDWDIDETEVIVADGSGLSRHNYASASLIADVLERLYRDPAHRDPFAGSLPVAGKDGTISTRMRRTRAEGNAIAKTGSLTGVRALSGYVRSQDGEPIVFSILANGFTLPSATITWVADLAVEILSNFSRARKSRD
jgi:serine-type D-Ala-D-Ala carboxypeptidase/endopeptidase (penicillin-binding protein 4)